MKIARLSSLIITLAILIVGCSQNGINDETEIQALLEKSAYVGEGALEASDDGTNNPMNIYNQSLMADTFPYCRWVRWIERPVTWVYNIIVTGDSAEATITAYFHGSPPGYGLFVINDLSGPIWQRSITDSVVRKIKLCNDGDGWRILSLTPADIYTVNSNYPITITEVKARVENRGYEFIVNNANNYFTKEELPTFLPGDTIEVTVTVSVLGDSSWAFLHHGARPLAQVGLRPHYRDPFYKEATNVFKRTWVIADDSVVTPGVRHAAFDVLTWQALFGDSLAEYSGHAWSLPYIVKTPDQDIPGDEE